MSSIRFGSLVCAILLWTTLASAASHVVVLVPGYGNRLSPGPYFSRTVRQALQDRGLQTLVVTNLSPLGTLHWNGEKMLAIFRQLRANPEYAHAQIDVIGHSAGGLYALYAISKAPELGIRNVWTIATPYAGVQFIGKATQVLPILERMFNAIDIRSLPELKPELVAQFVSTLRVPDDTKITAFASSQSRGLDVTDCRHFLWPMAIVDSVTPGGSDGIVGVPSQLGVEVRIPTSSGRGVQIRRGDIEYHLDHWEEVLDYRFFIALSERNVGIIRERQYDFYSALGDEILSGR